MKTRFTFLAIILFAFLFVFIISAKQKDNDNNEQPGLDWFKEQAPAFLTSVEELKERLSLIKNNKAESLSLAKQALVKCRLQYKKIAFFLEYYFPNEAAICNGPPNIDPEEDEIIEPTGFQVIETWLYEPNAYEHNKEYIRQTDLMYNAIEKILPLINDFKTTDAAFLQSLNLELIRIMTLYLTGFDAPELKTGVEESYQSLTAIEVAVKPFCQIINQKDSVNYYLTSGREYLKANNNFNSLNRLFFLTRFALPFQRILIHLMNQANGEKIFYTSLNKNSRDLFTPNAIDKEAFPNAMEENDSGLRDLGRQLFFEKALSKNNTRSCASCHNPKLYFTDGLARNTTLDGSNTLPRNTPSLLYSGFQFTQFWDGRVSSLESQASAVIKNQNEMGGSNDLIIERLKKDKKYINAFKKIWPKNPNINIIHLTQAISAFVRSLSPFTSAFDDYMKGNYSALSSSQRRGFNLFMGKARCGSCHYAPVFNGLLPPTYISTEFEVTGMIGNNNLSKAHLDSDLGRNWIIQVPSYIGAFKTPTVRNVAMTGPYMHNGVFKSLSTLLDFYDKGGGLGLGLNIPQQTLSSRKLNLTNTEKQDIIAFMKSLTDKRP